MVWSAVGTLTVSVHDTLLLVDALTLLDVVADGIWGHAQLVVLRRARDAALELLGARHDVSCLTLCRTLSVFKEI